MGQGVALRPSRRPSALYTAPFFTALRVQAFSRPLHLLLTFLRLSKLPSTSSASSALLVALRALTKPPGAGFPLPSSIQGTLSLQPGKVLPSTLRLLSPPPTFLGTPRVLPNPLF